MHGYIFYTFSTLWFCLITLMLSPFLFKSTDAGWVFSTNSFLILCYHLVVKLWWWTIGLCKDGRVDCFHDHVYSSGGGYRCWIRLSTCHFSLKTSSLVISSIPIICSIIIQPARVLSFYVNHNFILTAP